MFKSNINKSILKKNEKALTLNKPNPIQTQSLTQSHFYK